MAAFAYSQKRLLRRRWSSEDYVLAQSLFSFSILQIRGAVVDSGNEWLWMVVVQVWSRMKKRQKEKREKRKNPYCKRVSIESVFRRTWWPSQADSGEKQQWIPKPSYPGTRVLCFSLASLVSLPHPSPVQPLTRFWMFSTCIMHYAGFMLYAPCAYYMQDIRPVHSHPHQAPTHYSETMPLNPFCSWQAMYWTVRRSTHG